MGRDVNSHYYINDNPRSSAGNGNKYYDNASLLSTWPTAAVTRPTPA